MVTSRRERVVLLDRDGVINCDLETGVLRLDQLEMEAGAIAGLVALTKHNVRLGVCTNQACVGRGDLEMKELHRIHDHIDALVTAAGGRAPAWYVCTHRAEDGCHCRKPKSGLLQQAGRDFGFEPAATFFVGDDVRDIDAAVAASCRPFLVLTGKGKETAAERPDVPTTPSLRAFADQYLRGDL